ncbi:MAG: hypothetical protein V4444_01820 [Pseudomonadota bacterium]
MWVTRGRSAILTTEIDKYAAIVDRRNAIATGMLTAMFRADDQSVAEQISADMESARAQRAQKYPAGTFLVFRAEEDAPEPDLSTSRESEEFIVAFDAVDRKALEERHRDDLQNCVTAVGLNMDDQADHSIIAIGRASYLSAGESSKPIFSFTAEVGSPRASLARIIPQDRLEEATSLMNLLKREVKVGKIVDLYLQSIGQKDDDFRAFLSGWTAMEIFVHSLFKQVYGPQWFKGLKEKLPASAAPYFDRVQTVMSDKHRLMDKFVVIATTLSPATAQVDAAELASLKTVRDAIVHELAGQQTFPAERSQRLLRKYLALHLKRDT